MTDDERTTRGNAVELISLVLPLKELIEALTLAVRDSDSVVRRRAAAAGWSLAENFPELSTHTEELLRPYVEAMADQAMRSDTDEMARETLLGVAIDLAPVERAVELARASSGKLRGHAWRSLTRRLDRASLLRILAASEPLDEKLLNEIVENPGMGRREPWPTAEIVQLAHILANQDDTSSWGRNAHSILAEDPVAAMLRTSRPPAWPGAPRIRLAADRRARRGPAPHAHRSH